MSLLLLFQSAPGGGSYTLAGDAGAFVLTGQAADLKAGRRLTADAGAYNETGQAATLKAGREINGDAGAFTLTGQSAGLLTARRIAGDAGAYTLTGQDAALAKARGMVGEAGAYVVSGLDADLLSTATGAPAAPDYGWVGRVLGNYRTDEEVRRERIARGIIPDDTPQEVAQAVREAANLPTALQASRLRRLERDTAELGELLALTERLAEAQREAQKAAYDALMAELAQELTDYTQLQRRQNAIAVLTMLSL